MSSLGRNGLIGLGVGVTVSTGLIVFVIIKEVLRRRNQRLVLEVSRGALGASIPLAPEGGDSVSMAAALQRLSPEQHTELQNTLDEVMMSVASLRHEVAELRTGLRGIASTIIEDVRKGVEESQRSRRRRHILPRERSDSMSSSSIYFTASNGTSSHYDSEAEYATAYSNAESDYTDRETDRETDKEADREEDDDQDTDEEEERSCATVLTLRQDDSQPEEDDADEEGATAIAVAEVLIPELTLLLTQSDMLHSGDSRKKAEGFCLLRENKPQYGDSVEFLWRLARAYNDMCELAEDNEERRRYTDQGRDEAEAALQRNGLNAECHKWFAVLAGQSSQYESIHGKLKSSHILKEHLDRALVLRDDDPLCFYLLGRWCFEVSNLTWLEKKAAVALYETPPTSTLSDALENFLKAEELNPGFSKTVRLYIAKCHKELGNHSEARNWAQLALNMPANSHQEDGVSVLEEELWALIDSIVDL